MAGGGPDSDLGDRGELPGLGERGDAPPPGRDGGQVVVAGAGGVTLVEPGGQGRAAGQVLGDHVQAQAALIRKQATGRTSRPWQHARAVRGGTGLDGCGQDRVQVHVKRPAQPPTQATARTGRLRDQQPLRRNRLATGHQDQPAQLVLVLEPSRLAAPLALAQRLLRLLAWHLSPPVPRPCPAMANSIEMV
jgi:hypothetical protein